MIGDNLSGAAGRIVPARRQLWTCVMANRNGARRRLMAAALCGALLSGITPPLLAGGASTPSVLRPGDAIVTAFPGEKADGSLPANVHPLDRTFVDPEQASAKIFDLSALGLGARGQLSDLAPKFEIRAGEVGQVFGVALEEQADGQSANAYLAATSMFGLQLARITSTGGLERLIAGAPGAIWAPGQFGASGGTPGSIYKVDGATGQISLFANVQHEGRPNSGAALGNLAFDPVGRQLFVPDLESGLIHRFSLSGEDRGTFDHGLNALKGAGLDAVAFDPSKRVNIESAAFQIEDPKTWGYAPDARRVFAVAVHQGRLYYSVAEGPSVWSVGLASGGAFGADPRIELDVSRLPAGSEITTILFDTSGQMYLALRGAKAGSYDYTAFASPQQSSVLRFKWLAPDGRWASAPDEYSIGLAPDHRLGQGGIAFNYGYDKNGNLDRSRCQQTLWTTGEHLRESDAAEQASTGGAKIVHGLQGNDIALVRPGNSPPTQSWFLDYDGRFDDATVFGHMGAVAILAPCAPAAKPQSRTPPPPAVVPAPTGSAEQADRSSGLVLDKVCYPGAVGGRIRCVISVRNTMDRAPLEPVRIVDVTKVSTGSSAGSLVEIAAFTTPDRAITCLGAGSTEFSCVIPPASLPPGELASIDVWVDTGPLVQTGNLGFRNCATLKHPDGYDQACAEGGAGIAVEKIGAGSCRPGEPCKSGLRIVNTGTMPFAGDVLLADALQIGGISKTVPITSISPALTCAGGPVTQLPFSCTSYVALAAGEEMIYWIEVTMPAPGGYVAENCFGALDPSLLPQYGGGAFVTSIGKGNPSCVTVNVPAPVVASAPTANPPLGLIPAAVGSYPRCSDGRPRRPDGTCPCPLGTHWDGALQACERSKPHCYDGNRRRGDGSCCPQGTRYDSYSGRCSAPAPQCYDAERRRDDGSCCPRGTVSGADGRRCVTIERACPAGTSWNYYSRTCVPLLAACGYGQYFNWRRGRCDAHEKGCAWGMQYNRQTQSCELIKQGCPAGSYYSRLTKRCESDTQGDRCPLYRPRNPQTGKCEYRQIPGRDACPPYQIRLGGVCVPDRVVIPGKDHNDPYPRVCPPGKRLFGRTCISDRIVIDPGKIIPNGPYGNRPLQACPYGRPRIAGVCFPGGYGGNARPGKDKPYPDMKIPGAGGAPSGPSGCGPGQRRYGRSCINTPLGKFRPLGNGSPFGKNGPFGKQQPDPYKPKYDRQKGGGGFKLPDKFRGLPNGSPFNQRGNKYGRPPNMGPGNNPKSQNNKGGPFKLPNFNQPGFNGPKFGPNFGPQQGGGRRGGGGGFGGKLF